jgi:hypothetical protein
VYPQLKADKEAHALQIKKAQARIKDDKRALEAKTAEHTAEIKAFKAEAKARMEGLAGRCKTLTDIAAKVNKVCRLSGHDAVILLF